MGCCASGIENEVYEGCPDQFPHYAPPVEHIFINSVVKTCYKIASLTRTSTTSDTSFVYQHFADQYNLGYKLLEFLPFPKTMMVSGLRSTEQVYQGIFYKDSTEEDPGNFWQLHVEPASHSTEGSFDKEGWNRTMTTTYDMSELFEKINLLTANGGRYLGLTETGLDSGFSGGFNSMKCNGAVKVDLLFEIPRGPPKEIYVYRTLSQQVLTERTVYYTLKSKIDYLAVVEDQLAEGWRLITAFMDTGTMSLVNMKRFRVTKNQTECLFVFEKPSSRMDDNTRRYELKVIEFPYKIRSGGFYAVQPASMWNATIENMGRQGWYITTILPTPERRSSGCLVITKVLLFFQRKIC